MKRCTLLVLVAALIGLAGCKSDDPPGMNEERISDAREAVRENISDVSVAGKMIAVLDAFQKDVNSIETAITEKRAEIVEANADYNTSNEELEKLYAEIEEQVRKLGNAFRDRNFELRALCPPDQWKKIAGDDDTLVEFTF